jgi:hypothetical protein
VLFVVGLISLLLVVWIGLAFRYHYQNGLAERHQACLANIQRMEPELFPDLPKELAWVTVKMSTSPTEMMLKPGAAWLVSEPEKIQVYRNPGKSRHY